MVDDTTIADAVSLAIERARQGRRATPALLATVNAHSVVLADASPRFAEILNSAQLSIPDGMSIVAGARLLGHPLRARVPGVDLVEELCKRSAEAGVSVYFLGGRPGAGARTAARMAARYPGFILAGIDCPPHDFEHNAEENVRVLERIREAAPDILFVALGMPKQEHWIAQNAARSGVAVVMPVGGSFELLGGLIPRAPRWLQNVGLEWLFRMTMEPRRLWRRYLFGNLRFIALMTARLLERAALAGDGAAPRPFKDLKLEGESLGGSLG